MFSRHHFFAYAGLAALVVLAHPHSPLGAEGPQAVTYVGTIGSDRVVVEITEADDGPLLGRFSRLADGVDVPLHALARDETSLHLVQEVPCTQAVCVDSDDGTFDPPLGAEWRLHVEDGGERLSGSWQDRGDTMPVALERAGSRVYDRFDGYAYQSFVWNGYTEPLTAEISPFDYHKMQVELTAGEVVPAAYGASYRMVVDPRTRFAFPRVAVLPEGQSTEAVNHALAAMHWDLNLIGFSCLSGIYQSAGWTEGFNGGVGTLGSVDEENVTVDYLSPSVMSIVQGGSIFCGGGSPWNHINYVTLDVASGKPLDLSRVFKGWVPTQDGKPVELETARQAPMQYSWGPDAELVAFLRKQLPEVDYAPECETAARIADHLDISFSGDDVAEFRIDNLESAELPCEGTFASIPLRDIPELLAPVAAALFPALR